MQTNTMLLHNLQFLEGSCDCLHLLVVLTKNTTCWAMSHLRLLTAYNVVHLHFSTWVVCSKYIDFSSVWTTCLLHWQRKPVPCKGCLISLQTLGYQWQDIGSFDQQIMGTGQTCIGQFIPVLTIY